MCVKNMYIDLEESALRSGPTQEEVIQKLRQEIVAGQWDEALNSHENPWFWPDFVSKTMQKPSISM